MNMNELYDKMEEKNWNYSRLEFRDMYYYRAIHMLAVALRNKDKEYFNILSGQGEMLRRERIEYDRNQMIQESKEFSEYEIPLHVVQGSGGFCFEGKTPPKTNYKKYKI